MRLREDSKTRIGFYAARLTTAAALPSISPGLLRGFMAHESVLPPRAAVLSGGTGGLGLAVATWLSEEIT